MNIMKHNALLALDIGLFFWGNAEPLSINRNFQS
jgi:hypothetical protein